MPGYFSFSSCWNLLVNRYPVSKRRYIERIADIFTDILTRVYHRQYDKKRCNLLPIDCISFLFHSLCILISLLSVHRNIKSHMFLVLIDANREEEVNCFNNGVRHYDCKCICCSNCYKLFKK